KSSRASRGDGASKNCAPILIPRRFPQYGHGMCSKCHKKNAKQVIFLTVFRFFLQFFFRSTSSRMIEVVHPDAAGFLPVSSSHSLVHEFSRVFPAHSCGVSVIAAQLRATPSERFFRLSFAFSRHGERTATSDFRRKSTHYRRLFSNCVRFLGLYLC